MIFFTQRHNESPKSPGKNNYRIILFLWLTLVVIGVFMCLFGSIRPAKHTEITDIENYGVYTGTNDDAFTQRFINSFFPMEIAPSMEVLKYTYRAENLDTYGFEAYLEIRIDDPALFENHIQSIAPAEKWVQFGFSDEYMEYSIENMLDISIRSPEDWAQRPYHPIECARIRKVLYSAKSQTIIYVAIGVYDGGGVGTNYLHTFFDRFNIDPVIYEENANSPYMVVSP